MKSPFLRLLTVSLAWASILSISAAAHHEKDDKDKKIDPASIELLEATLGRLAEASTASAEIDSRIDIRGEGMQQELVSAHSFHFQRPNKFALIARSGEFAETVISDGDELTTYYPMLDRYLVNEAPESFDGYIQQESNTASLGNSADLIRTLLSDGTVKAAFGAIEEASIAKEETDGDSVSHRIRLVTSMEEMLPGDLDETELDEEARAAVKQMAETFADLKLVQHFLVEKDSAGHPVLRKTETDLTPFFKAMMKSGNPTGLPDDLEMQQVVEYTDWQFDPEIPDERFVFQAPEGAEEAESMEDLMSQAGGGTEEPHALLGEPAPAFELNLLEDGRVKLEDHIGEDVLVLDFWATWCGPCIHAMPILIEVTDEYKDRGVTFYAINIREEPEQVKKFIADQEWNLKTPLDRDGDVANSYQVSGIPQTVVIGKSGKVEAVHVGFSPRVGETLRKELDILIEGGSLLDNEER